jgi:hypothetical protein
MPSSSKKQHNFMAAIANNPAFAKKVGIPQSVGKDFNEADKGKKFGSGGVSRADIQKVNKPKTDHGKMAFFKEGGNTMASKMNAGFMAMMAKKKGATKMAEGGMSDMKQDKSMMQKAVNKHEGRLHKGSTMTKLAGGGSASKRADGVATKGKTKGTMIGMKSGGKAC